MISDANQTPISETADRALALMASGEWYLGLQHPNPAAGYVHFDLETGKEIARRAALKAVIPPDADVAGVVERLNGHPFDTNGNTDVLECLLRMSEGAALITRLSAELAEARAERDAQIERANTNFTTALSQADRATAAEAERDEARAERNEAEDMTHKWEDIAGNRLVELTAAEAERDRYRRALEDAYGCGDLSTVYVTIRAALGEKADGDE